MSSVGSVAAPDNQHIKRLILACSAGNEQDVRQLLIEHQDWTSPLDRDALRHGLQRVAARGNIGLAEFLLEAGAEFDARRDTEVAAIFRAAENGHVKIARALVERKANLEARDRYGRTAVFPAALKGYVEVLKVLVGAGANVNARDKDGKTVLIHLASEKLFRWNEAVCRYLLEAGNADVEALDSTKRTALTWAADYGKFEMVKLLLEGKKKVNVEANNNRGRNALHFAAEKNHENIVALLLEHGSNPRISSDGGWTALHNAAEKGHLRVVELLLAAGASVNAELSNGMTALHWAAQNGHEEVVKAILQRTDSKLSIKDSFDRTPMLCAAEQGHRDIVHLLSPGRNGNRLSPAALGACESFEATVVDFGIDAVPRERKQRVLKNSVFDLIYGWDNANDKPKVPTQVKNIKVNPSFRWIHIPANNLAWVEAMLTKAFVEAGHREIDDFKALEKCFSQEHRGAQVHASFMRPFCHRIPPMSVAKAYNSNPESPIIIQEEGAAGAGSSTTPLIYVEPATPGSTPLKGSLATLPERSGDKSDRSDRENTATPKSERKKTKSEKLAERHGKKGTKTDSPKGTPSKVKGGERHPHPKPKPTPSPSLPSGKLVLFIPFLHYESDSSRQKMSQAIRRTYIHNDPSLKAPERPTADDLLIEAYLSSTPALHARRTLDQFFYHGIDTSERDQDQVVYRYCKRRNLERKVFMVDQLWMWILGKDLIITSFPQRWQQPKNDPLNVLDGIIEDMNAKTRPPVKSVYDLAMLITSRCSGMFDRHRFDDENYQFIDMFESSIGHVTNKETKLFARFNRASAVAGQWLKENRRGRGARRILMGKTDIQDDEDAMDDNDPIFVDTLLDIGTETKLLAEIKDIRDELNIIRMVLTSQLNILPDLAENISDELGKKHTIEAGELRKRSREQMKIIEVHIKDLDRMDKQADLIYNSLTHLLDLKQKHANAFEARFARDQAALTARQGQTIMVFTIVTIVFLPMGFIASFFNINIAEFKRVGEASEIPLNYVAKFMFGIGLGISIPLIFLAFAVDDVINLAKRIAKFFVWMIPGLPLKPKKKNTRLSRKPDDELWSRRYSESRYSETTEKHRVRTEMWEAPPRNSFQRDLSPLSHRTGRSTLYSGNHVSWNRADNERGRLSDDL